MTPTLSPQQREEVLEAMFRVNHHPLAEPSSIELQKLGKALDAALPAIIGAVEKDVLQRECSAYTVGLMDGWGCGEARNQEAFDFHWHHSPYRLAARALAEEGR